MIPARRHTIVLALAAVAACAVSGSRLAGDAPAPIPPVNDAPNPYVTVKDYFRLPAGRTWGSTSAIEVDTDGRSIWIAERCGKNSCLDPATNTIENIPTILKFGSGGNLVKAFGEGLMVFPHGFYVDRDDNIWVTDGQDNAPRPAPAVAPAAPAGPPKPPVANPAATKGHQVFKFSPDGKILMTLGRPGGAPAPECCFQPNDVITAPNGDIFVTEGHASIPGTTARILKFDKTGKLLKTVGKLGGGDSEFDQPHALAFDSRGRLFVGDRNNNRIQIFDQNLNLLDKWYQFSRPSGVYIDKNDMIYVADSESLSVSRNHQDWKRGIRIGSVKDGKVIAFIPDPNEEAKGTSAAEGVVADAMGNVYGAEVGPKAVNKYVKR